MQLKLNEPISFQTEFMFRHTAASAEYEILVRVLLPDSENTNIVARRLVPNSAPFSTVAAAVLLALNAAQNATLDKIAKELKP